MRRQKFIAFVLTIIMVLSLLPAVSFAQDENDAVQEPLQTVEPVAHIEDEIQENIQNEGNQPSHENGEAGKKAEAVPAADESESADTSEPGKPGNATEKESPGITENKSFSMEAVAKAYGAMAKVYTAQGQTRTNGPSFFSIEATDDYGDPVNDLELTIYHVNSLNQRGAIAARWDRDSSGVVTSTVGGSDMTGPNAGKIDGLAAGRYVIDVTRLPAGYAAANPIYFTWTNTNTLQITTQNGTEIPNAPELSYEEANGYTIHVVSKQKPVPIALTKYWEGTTNPIENMHFEIYRYTSQDKSASEKITNSGQTVFKTNSLGNLVLDNGNEILLGTGGYFLKEVENALSPSDVYINPSNKTEFDISYANLITYENDPAWKKQIGNIYNFKFKSKIKAYCYDPEKPHANQGMAGVGLELVRMDNGVEVSYGGSPAGSGQYATGANGELEITIDKKGVYRLYKNTAAQTGYRPLGDENGFICEISIADGDYNQEIKISQENVANGKIRVAQGIDTITDTGLKCERYRGSIALYQKDGDTGGWLNGAVYKLYRKQDNAPIGTEYVTGKEYRNYTSSNTASFDDGGLKIGGLEWGDYYITEHKPASGYVGNEARYSFTIEAANAKDGIDIASAANAIKSYKNSLGLSVQDADTKAPTDNTLFRVVNSTGKPASFVLDNNVATVVPEGTQNSVTELSLGALSLRGLPSGTHALQHAKPLEGYQKNKDYQFSIDDKGTVSAVDNSPLYQVSNSTKTIAVSIKKSAVTIKNTNSSGTPIGGAEFELYFKDDTAPVFTGTVPQQGLLALDGVVTGCAGLGGNIGIPDAWYRLVQTKAPTGYRLNNDLYFFLGDDNTIYYSSQKPSVNTLFTASGTEATLTIAMTYIDHSIIERPDPNKPLDTTKDAVFAFNGEYANIAGVRLNGHVLTITPTSSTQASLSGFPSYKPELGNIKSGSVIVTLYKEFLQSLPDSTYSLEVLFDDGEKGTVSFEISRNPLPVSTEQEKPSPKTGDDTSILLWIVLCTVAGASILGSALYRRRKMR